MAPVNRVDSLLRQNVCVISRHRHIDTGKPPKSIPAIFPGRGIETHDHLAVVLSRASVQSEWVRKELNAALAQMLQGFGALPDETLALEFENARELIRMLDEIFASRTRDEWGRIFDAEEDLWWAPVQT